MNNQNKGSTIYYLLYFYYLLSTIYSTIYSTSTIYYLLYFYYLLSIYFYFYFYYLLLSTIYSIYSTIYFYFYYRESTSTLLSTSTIYFYYLLLLSTIYFYYREGEDGQVTVGDFCSEERDGRGLAIGGSMNFFRFSAFKLGPQDTKSFWQNSHGCYVLAKNSHGSHVCRMASAMWHYHVRSLSG
jgi:hypothetical protein